MTKKIRHYLEMNLLYNEELECRVNKTRRQRSNSETHSPASATKCYVNLILFKGLKTSNDSLESDPMYLGPFWPIN